jgi:general stress protein 26
MNTETVDPIQPASPSDDAPHAQNIQKLGELIEGIDVAMLTTVCPDGSFHTRPMGTQKAPFDGVLWFFTGEHSPKVGELQTNSRVSLGYAEPSHNRYVAVSGRGEIVHDRALAERLWNPIYKAWFPKGLEDPELAILKVTVEKAEFWDAHSSKIVQLIGFAKAIATGHPYRPGPDEHQKLDLTA